MLIEKYSIKTIWTKICISHLYKNQHIYLNQLDEDATNDNIDVLYTLLSNISNICGEIFDSCVPKGIEKLRQDVENLLLKSMLDVQVEQLARYTKQYCESFIQWCECPEKLPHFDNLFIGFHEVMSKSPVRIEYVFTDAIVLPTKEYLRGILNEYQHEYNINVLDKLIDKVKETVVDRVLPLLFPKTQNKSSLLPENIVYQVYFDTRMPLIFEIIMEYPDSIPALQDIGRCVLILNTRAQFSTQLTKSIKERLLQPALETSHMITAYMCVIKALKIIDSRYLSEESILPSIKRTLLKRGDIVMAIVDKILSIDNDSEDNSPVLTSCEVHAEKLKDSQGTPNETYESVYAENDSFDFLDVTHRRFDTLSLLLSIHNNKEVLMSEYKTLLSKRLFSNMNFDIGKELKNIELLKCRYGSQNLKHCDVMLKDIRESKRVTKTIRDKVNKYRIPTMFDVNPYIISANYWPKIPDNEFKVPEFMATEFDTYARLYSEHKGNRELKWYHGLASVDIEVTVDDQNVRLEVTSLQAAVIHYFSEKPRWELQKLAEVLEAKIGSVRSSIHLWIEKRVLTLVEGKGMPETYAVVEEGHATSCDVKKTLSQLRYANDQEDEEENKDEEATFYESLWFAVSWILKMTSERKKTIDFDGILSMIPMYVQDDAVEVTKEHLTNLLDRKLSERLITVCQKNYELKK